MAVYGKRSSRLEIPSADLLSEAMEMESSISEKPPMKIGPKATMKSEDLATEAAGIIRSEPVIPISIPTPQQDTDTTAPGQEVLEVLLMAIARVVARIGRERSVLVFMCSCVLEIG